jgi:hypothetical protein
MSVTLEQKQVNEAILKYVKSLDMGEPISVAFNYYAGCQREPETYSAKVTFIREIHDL